MLENRFKMIIIHKLIKDDVCRKQGMQFDLGSQFEPFCKNYVHRYVSVVLFDSSIRCQRSTLLLIFHL